MVKEMNIVNEWGAQQGYKYGTKDKLMLLMNGEHIKDTSMGLWIN